MSKLLKQLLLVSVVAAALAACSSAKPPVASEPVASEPVASEPVVVAPPVVNHNAVYFAFDKYDVKEGYNGIVDANAKYLSSNANAKVQVQGNTDDIGSVEYNLALGQRRANAVKKALIAAGAHKVQVEAVSFGKLKAKYANDTDASRAMNRRSDITYKADAPKGYSEDNNGLPVVDGEFYNGSVEQGVQ
ncbi:MAG: OmpA family protein [Neisseriaceae bacterium]